MICSVATKFRLVGREREIEREQERERERERVNEYDCAYIINTTFTLYNTMFK